MFPFYKLFTYSVKTLAKPFASFISAQSKTLINKKSRFASVFSSIGNSQNRLEMMLNKRILGIETDMEMFYQALNDDIAIEKGVESVIKYILYAFLFTITILEYNRYAKDKEISFKKERAKFLQIEHNLEELIKFHRVLRTDIDHLGHKIEVMRFDLTSKLLLGSELKKLDNIVYHQLHKDLNN